MLDFATADAEARSIVDGLDDGCRDYEVVRRAIEEISEDWRAQPSVEEVARRVGLDADRLTRLFQRWA